MNRLLPFSSKVSLVMIATTIAAVVGLCQSPSGWTDGPADAVFANAGRAYFGSGTFFVIGDVSDISTPQPLGSIDVGSTIGDIMVVGDVAHIAAGDMNQSSGAFLQIDVSDPAAPELLLSFETQWPARSLWVTDPYAYIGLADPSDQDNGALIVLDLRSSGDPREVVRLPLTGWPEEIVRDGDLLWITELGRGVRAVNVSEPSQAFDAAFIEGDIRDATAADSILYLAEWGVDRDDALLILDVIDPSAPVELGRYDAIQPRQVAVSGPAVHLLSGPAETSFRLEVIDVSSPEDPQREGILSVGSQAGNLLIHDLAFSARIAYVTHSQGGPLLIDARDRDDPQRSGSFVTPGVTSGFDVASGLLGVAGGSSGLLLFDSGLSRVFPPPGVTPSDFVFAEDVALSGDTAYVASLRDGIRIFDLTDPDDPTELEPIETGFRFFRVVADGEYLYGSFVGNPYVTTAVFRVSDPSNPVIVGEIPGGVLAVRNGYAYADWSDWLGQCGLATWDVGDPASPGAEPTNINFWGGCRPCEWPWPGYPPSHSSRPEFAIGGFAASMDRGWVALGSGGLSALDLSDPAAPVRAGIIDIDACGMAGVAADEDTAWVTTNLPSGLLAVRWADDGELTVEGFNPLPGSPADAVVFGGSVVTANGTAGLTVVGELPVPGPRRPRGRRSP